MPGRTISNGFDMDTYQHGEKRKIGLYCNEAVEL